MADKRLTLRANDDVLSDVEIIAAATGLATSDVLRVAVRRLAEAYRFMDDMGRDPADHLSDGTTVLLMPIRRLCR